MKEQKNYLNDSDLKVCPECSTPKKYLLSLPRFARAFLDLCLIIICSDTPHPPPEYCPTCGSDYLVLNQKINEFPPHHSALDLPPLSCIKTNNPKHRVIQPNLMSLWTKKALKSYKHQYVREWRRGPESNRRIEDLQSPALPLGYRAVLQNIC